MTGFLERVNACSRRGGVGDCTHSSPAHISLASLRGTHTLAPFVRERGARLGATGFGLRASELPRRGESDETRRFEALLVSCPKMRVILYLQSAETLAGSWDVSWQRPLRAS